MGKRMKHLTAMFLQSVSIQAKGDDGLLSSSPSSKVEQVSADRSAKKQQQRGSVCTTKNTSTVASKPDPDCGVDSRFKCSLNDIQRKSHTNDELSSSRLAYRGRQLCDSPRLARSVDEDCADSVCSEYDSWAEIEETFHRLYEPVLFSTKQSPELSDSVENTSICSVKQNTTPISAQDQSSNEPQLPDHGAINLETGCSPTSQVDAGIQRSVSKSPVRNESPLSVCPSDFSAANDDVYVSRSKLLNKVGSINSLTTELSSSDESGSKSIVELGSTVSSSVCCSGRCCSTTSCDDWENGSCFTSESNTYDSGSVTTAIRLNSGLSGDSGSQSSLSSCCSSQSCFTLANRSVSQGEFDSFVFAQKQRLKELSLSDKVHGKGSTQYSELPKPGNTSVNLRREHLIRWLNNFINSENLDENIFDGNRSKFRQRIVEDLADKLVSSTVKIDWESIDWKSMLLNIFNANVECDPNVNLGFIYVPMEEYFCATGKSLGCLEANTDVDTFGSLDSLIFEPKSVENDCGRILSKSDVQESPSRVSSDEIMAEQKQSSSDLIVEGDDANVSNVRCHRKSPKKINFLKKLVGFSKRLKYDPKEAHRSDELADESEIRGDIISFEKLIIQKASVENLSANVLPSDGANHLPIVDSLCQDVSDDFSQCTCYDSNEAEDGSKCISVDYVGNMRSKFGERLVECKVGSYLGYPYLTSNTSCSHHSTRSVHDESFYTADSLSPRSAPECSSMADSCLCRKNYQSVDLFPSKCCDNSLQITEIQSDVYDQCLHDSLDKNPRCTLSRHSTAHTDPDVVNCAFFSNVDLVSASEKSSAVSFCLQPVVVDHVQATSVTSSFLVDNTPIYDEVYRARATCDDCDGSDAEAPMDSLDVYNVCLGDQNSADAAVDKAEDAPVIRSEEVDSVLSTARSESYRTSGRDISVLNYGGCLNPWVSASSCSCFRCNAESNVFDREGCASTEMLEHVYQSPFVDDPVQVYQCSCQLCLKSSAVDSDACRGMLPATTCDQDSLIYVGDRSLGSAFTTATLLLPSYTLIAPDSDLCCGSLSPSLMPTHATGDQTRLSDGSFARDS